MEHKEFWIVTLIADQESFDVRYKLRTFTQVFNDEFKDVEINDATKSNVFQRANGLINIIFNEEEK